MQTATLKYLDTSNAIHTATVEVLSTRGIDEPDDVEFFPAILETYRDGSTGTKFTGFRRVISMDVLTVDDRTTDKFIEAWLAANKRSLTYNESNILGIETFVVPDNAKKFDVVLLNGAKIAKRWPLRLVENVLRQTWPDYPQPVVTDEMYIAKNVTIVGTEASPETFTTNAGKLLYNYGTTPFPSISLLSYNVSVVVVTKQDCVVNRVGDIVQSGSDISFQLAISNAGTPLFDGSGNPYVIGDIIIGLQSI